MKTRAFLAVLILGCGVAAARSSASVDDPAPRESTVATLPGTNVVLNFRGAPLKTIVERLADASGFAVVLETELSGTADLYSAHPVTAEEALSLLHSMLFRNGYAALRSGKTLTILKREDAKTRDIAVRLGSEPESIPATAEIATQVIPLRHADASKVIKDLQPLVSTNATLTADQSGNTIVLTDTQIAIRRIAQVARALDDSAKSLTVVRVFKLKNADPEETAELLHGVWPDPTATRPGAGILAPGGNAPENAGGSEGPEGDQSTPAAVPPAPSLADRFAGFMAARAAADQARAEAGSQQVQKNTRLTVVADPRTSSVVVSASESMMPQVEKIIAELDASDARKETVRIYQLRNSSPAAVQRVLQDVFEPANGTSRATAESVQPDALEQRSENELREQTAPGTSRLNRATRPNRYGTGTGTSFAD